jgi:hypothetical protein
MIDQIVLLLHIIFFYAVAISPLINDIRFKKCIYILLCFICLQFIIKYGKCGLINCERLILKDKFREGFLFKLIRPVISYKINPFYSQYFKLLLIYILILYVQLDKMGHRFNFYNEINESFANLLSVIKNK